MQFAINFINSLRPSKWLEGDSFLRQVAFVPLKALRRILRQRWVQDGVCFCVEMPAACLTGRLPPSALLDYGRQLLPYSWRMRRVRAETTYVFVFLGEFGYELFNWQGVVRKFSQQLPTSSNIVIGGRRGLEPFYESASEYIDISDFALYRDSIAAAYFALPPYQLHRYYPPSAQELRFDLELRAAIRSYLIERLNRPKRNLEFIFSSQLTVYPGCIFGVDRHFYGRPGRIGRIYYNEPEDRGFLDNNVYERIEPDLRMKREIEEKLGFKLEQPYVLVQMRRRQIGPQFGGSISENQLIEELARHIPVVFLSFNTGRLLDSGSNPEQMNPAVVYSTDSFQEQGCLIAHAKKCVFFTEGDLGSHTYLPSFLGKDVVVVASQEIFRRPSAPIAFWNEHVFCFGGQMIPWVVESIFASAESLREAVSSLMSSWDSN